MQGRAVQDGLARCHGDVDVAVHAWHQKDRMSIALPGIPEKHSAELSSQLCSPAQRNMHSSKSEKKVGTARP